MSEGGIVVSHPAEIPRKRYATGAFIFQSEPIDNTAYFIESGNVEIFAGDTENSPLLANLGPGNLFGDLSAIKCLPGNCSARAITPTVLLQFESFHVTNLINSTNPIAAYLAYILTDWLHHWHEDQTSAYLPLSTTILAKKLRHMNLKGVFRKPPLDISKACTKSGLADLDEEQLPATIEPRLEEVCNYIICHLEQPVSLAELEQVSGLSARSLQMAFQRHFHCTPMQWVRQARLEQAHYRLLQALPGTTVSMIALDCGFTQLGAFAKAYQERYGELPSETLRKRST